MTIKDKYYDQWKICLSKKIRAERNGHYKTTVDFAGKPFYVSADGEDVITLDSGINGCGKTRIVEVDGKKKKVQYHKDRLPVYGRICNKPNVKGLLYKYLLFLRCDGIEDIELLRLYVLHCLSFKFEYLKRKKPGKDAACWAHYEPEYDAVEKMVEGLISSAMRTTIDDKTKEQFVKRRRCVVNTESQDSKYGSKYVKTRGEINRDIRKGMRSATDNRISAQYNPRLTDKENADIIGLGVRRIQEWKADHKDEIESLEDRIVRLYDSTLSLRKNAENIGCSVGSVRKYAEQLKSVPAIEESEDTWIDSVLEKESSFWKDVPDVKRKDVDEDIEELLNDIEWPC